MESVKIKDNNKHYCAICGGEMEVENNYSYCPVCRSEYNKNYYKSHSQSQYIYMFITKKFDVLYCGSTCDPYRIQKHLNGQSNLNLNMAEWEHMGLDAIIYAEVTEFIKTKDERLYLEQLLINSNEPLLNKNEGSIDIDPERKAILDYYFKNDYLKFYNYNYKLETITNKKNNLDTANIGVI